MPAVPVPPEPPPRRLLRLVELLDRFAEWQGRVVSWLALVMVLIGSYNALARWAGRYIATDLSSNSLLEAQWYAFSALFLLCGAYTLKHDEHVRVDVFYGRLSPRGRALVDALGGLLLLIPFCVAAIFFTLPSVEQSWAIREVSPDPGGLPRYPLKTIVPIAFALLLLQALAEVTKKLLVFRQPEAFGKTSSTSNTADDPEVR